MNIPARLFNFAEQKNWKLVEKYGILSSGGEKKDLLKSKKNIVAVMSRRRPILSSDVIVTFWNSSEKYVENINVIREFS